MAVHVRAFGFQALLTVGLLTTVLAGFMVCPSHADEIDDARQTCDNVKANPDERIPACTRLLDSGRKDIDAGTIYSVRANAWYLKGNFENAISDYQAAVNRNPKLNSALQGLGNSYFRKADFHAAIKAYTDALAVEKKSAELYNNRGLAQLNVGEFSSAVKDFGEAIKINPKFVSAYNNRGIAYSKYKQFESAIRDFTKAVEIEPRLVDPYMSRAEVLIVEKADLDGGIKDYDKAISLDPKNWKAYSARGEALRLKGNLDRAMTDHEEAIRLNPSPESYGNRALTWRALALTSKARSLTTEADGDFERAISDYDDAILLNPNHAAAYAGRGEINRLKGDLDRSLADLEKAVTLNPKSPVTLYQRGETLRTMGTLDRAIADFDQALRVLPGLAAVHTARGLAYEAKGDVAKARADFDVALKLPSVSDAEITKPAQETARSHLAALDAKQLEAKQLEEARQLEARQKKSDEFAVANLAPPQATIADPGRRVALVIGMSAYATHARLPNAKRDAQAVAATLREVGFQNVVEGYDLDKSKLESTLKNFARQATDANWAVVYYAGHGIEIGGVNYLIPVDAKLQTDRDVNFEAVSLEHVMLAVEGAKKFHLVLLDACRENPFARTMQRTAGLASRSIVSRGLASIEPEAGTMVVYAARAGEVALDGVGDHSPFATALISNFKKPKVEIRKLVDLVRDDVMKATDRHQLPFHYGTLPGDEDFYFRWK
jgi:tetratricopeptide (TPR) repeat protein